MFHKGCRCRSIFFVSGSNPNTSSRRRAGVALRYMPTTSVLDRTVGTANKGYTVDWANRPMFLLRGVDRSGRNTFMELPK